MRAARESPLRAIGALQQLMVRAPAEWARAGHDVLIGYWTKLDILVNARAARHTDCGG